MIFFVGNDGTVVKGVPSPVYQGGANANTVYLIAPFAENLTASVAFQLPNGVAVAPAPMTGQGSIGGITDAQGNVYSGWSYDLPNSITALYGTVIAQFFFYTAQGKVVASSAANFTVGRGVPAVLPDEPSDDVYAQLLSAIGSLQSDLANGYYASRAVYAWNSTYTYGMNEITFYPGIGQYGAFVKSVAANNTNNVPYVDGAVNSAYWAEVVNFNTVTADFFGEIKAAQEAAETAQAAAETAETNAQTAERGAQAAQSAAETAAGQAGTAAKQAADSASAASGSAGAASGSAGAAEGSATAAAGAAGTATESAKAAALSATAAQGYMEQAKEYAKKEYKLYDSVSDLPQPGDSAFIYLVPKQSGSEANDEYSEYLWISETESYEYIGTINDVDLSNYAQIDGSYPNMKVGEAVYAQSASTADTAGYATTAKGDAQGDDIQTTYARQNGSYPNMTVGSANSAANDGEGRKISETYVPLSAVSAETEANTIPQRYGNGCIDTAAPVNDTNAANKGYVDQQDAALGGRIDDIVDGTTPVAKATADGNGLNIANNYVKTTASLRGIYALSTDGTPSVLALTAGGETTVFHQNLIPSGIHPKVNDIVVDKRGTFGIVTGVTTTSSGIQATVETIFSPLNDSHPVGSLVLTRDYKSPASYLGGTWSMVGSGYALWTTTVTGGFTTPAGLPNITGSAHAVWACATFDNEATADGAFSLGTKVTTGHAGGNGWEIYLYDLNMDASDANSIYGKSTTVQPPAYNIFAWYRVA